jgi:hypothetical protein
MAVAESKTWSKTKVQGLLRHRGGGLYARLYVAGKEKWVSLGTSVLEVAKVKMVEEKAAIRAVLRDGWAPARGTIAVKAAIAVYLVRLENRVGL